MYTVDSLWDTSVRNGARRVAYADLYYSSGTVIGFPGSAAATNLPVNSYSITVDRNAKYRRSGSITITSEELLAQLRTAPGVSPLEPYGSEIRLRVGVVHANGVEFTVPLGSFGIEKLEWDEPESLMHLTVFDRSKIIERAHREFPIDAFGESLTSLFDYIIHQPMPWVDINYAAEVAFHDYLLPAGTIYYHNDALTLMRDLLATIGAEFWFDPNGDIQVDMIPGVTSDFTAADQADWIVDARENGVMISARPSVSREDTYNIVTVFGAPANDTAAQPYAIVRDEDPESPTYSWGPFGEVDLVFEVQELTTNAACTQMAEGKLASSKGLSRGLSLTCLANAALEAGDKLLVVFSDGREELHILDSFSLTEEGSMSLTTRLGRDA